MFSNNTFRIDLVVHISGVLRNFCQLELARVLEKEKTQVSTKGPCHLKPVFSPR